MQDKTGTSLTSAATASKHHSVEEPPRRVSVRHLSFLVATAIFILVLDQGTKAWAVDALKDGAARDVLGSFLRFQLTFNPGAAFSMGTNSTIIITGIAILVVVFIAFSARKLHSFAWACAFGLIMGGALGNLGDRFFRAPGGGRGHVVDFLQLPHWPIFNVADSAICCAAVLIVVLSFRGIGLDGVKETARQSAPSSKKSGEKENA